MSIKVLYEMFKSYQFRTGRMKIMKPILKNAVEDTITSEMDFDHVKRLQEMQAENAKVNAFNSREIKYLDARSCC